MTQPYYARSPLGQTVTATPIVPATGTSLYPSTPERQVFYIGGFLATGALAYHGYKRNNSIGWALLWAFLGGIVWPVAVPIAVAQGFGRPASLKRNRRSRRRR